MASVLPQVADSLGSLSPAGCPAPQHSLEVCSLEIMHAMPMLTLHLWLGCRTVTSLTLLQHTAAGQSSAQPAWSQVPGPDLPDKAEHCVLTATKRNVQHFLRNCSK